MKITVSSTERVFNRADRVMEERVYIVGEVALTDETSQALKRFAGDNSMNVSEVVRMALAFYFGDGADHLSCEFCGLFDGVRFCSLEPGTKDTLPLLDKGSVVVGLSDEMQGE